MRAKIIGRHHVSKVITDITVNGKPYHRKEYIVTKRKSGIEDRIVYNAINTVGNNWADVYNYLDKRMSENKIKAISNTIDKLTV